MWRLTGVVWAQAWFRLADPGEIDQYRQLCRKSVPDQLFMFRFGSKSVFGRCPRHVRVPLDSDQIADIA